MRRVTQSSMRFPKWQWSPPCHRYRYPSPSLDPGAWPAAVKGYTFRGLCRNLATEFGRDGLSATLRLLAVEFVEDGIRP